MQLWVKRYVFSFRRFLAFAVDFLLLSTLSMFLAGWFFDELVAFGQGGRVIGFLMVLLYFGIGNSRVTGGRTFGKWLFRLCVVDSDGAPLSVARSCLRSAILFIPFFLVSTDIRPLFVELPVPVIAQQVWCVLVVGIGGAMFYQFGMSAWFSEAGPILHDWAVRSAVVSAREKNPGAVHMSGPHVVAVLSIMVLAVLMPLFPLSWLDGSTFGRHLALPFKVFNGLSKDRTMMMAGYGTEAGANYSSDGTSANYANISVSVKLHERTSDFASVLRRVAAEVLSHESDLIGYQTLSVSAAYGSDLGLGSCVVGAFESRKANEWAQLLASPPAKAVAGEGRNCFGRFPN
jgi:uncharacterized RDD family membrane protein YckC